MKPNIRNSKTQESNSDKVDVALDNLLERVTNKLAKLKNNEYLIDYLVKSGLSIDMANHMIHPQSREHATK